MQEFDYGIIGAGPAGYTAGMKLALKGAAVVMFEKDCVGGTCLNRGCIPTKSLLHQSQKYADFIKELEKYGIEKHKPDFSEIMNKKNQTVEKLRKSLELAIKHSGAQVILGEARIKDKNTIIADNKEFFVKNIIVATGSQPRELKALPFNHSNILSSDDILNLTELPNSITIIGSGAIGIEWAKIFHNLGAEVTIVEAAEHLMPIADIEVSKRIERIFKQQKIKYYLNDSIKDFNNGSITLKSGIEFETEKILVAIGRTPISSEEKELEIIGDACGEIQLAHYAISQAKALSCNTKFNKTLVPSVIYGLPEIAWVGIREQDCDESFDIKTLPITALGKSWCDECTDGFIKLIFKDNKLKGAHIISKEASSLIHTALLAIQQELSLENLQEICFAHPTYAEGFGEIFCSI